MNRRPILYNTLANTTIKLRWPPIWETLKPMSFTSVFLCHPKLDRSQGSLFHEPLLKLQASLKFWCWASIERFILPYLVSLLWPFSRMICSLQKLYCTLSPMPSCAVVVTIGLPIWRGETSHAYYEYTYAQLFFFRHCEGLFVCNKDSSASEAVCVDASIEAITFDVQVMGKEVWRVRVDMEKARLISYRTGSTSNLNE